MKIYQNQKASALFLYIYEQGKAIPKKFKLIQEALSFSKADVDNTIRLLKKEGFIEVTKNEYRVLYDISKKPSIQFARFWDGYGKQIDRLGTLEEFNKLSQEDIDDMLKRLPAFLNEHYNVMYRPNPKTFLKNRRWKDLYIEEFDELVPLYLKNDPHGKDMPNRDTDPEAYAKKRKEMKEKEEREFRQWQEAMWRKEEVEREKAKKEEQNAEKAKNIDNENKFKKTF